MTCHFSLILTLPTTSSSSFFFQTSCNIISKPGHILYFLPYNRSYARLVLIFNNSFFHTEAASSRIDIRKFVRSFTYKLPSFNMKSESHNQLKVVTARLQFYTVSTNTVAINYYMLLCQVQLQLQLHARFLIVSVLVILMNQLRKRKRFQFIHETKILTWSSIERE